MDDHLKQPIIEQLSGSGQPSLYSDTVQVQEIRMTLNADHITDGSLPNSQHKYIQILLKRIHLDGHLKQPIIEQLSGSGQPFSLFRYCSSARDKNVPKRRPMEVCQIHSTKPKWPTIVRAERISSLYCNK